MKHIYLMRCPFTGDPVYVGKTTNFKSRVCMHLTNKKSPLLWFIEECRDNGKDPLFEIVVTVEDNGIALILEKALIGYYTKLYFLLNTHHNNGERLTFKEHGKLNDKS